MDHSDSRQERVMNELRIRKLGTCRQQSSTNEQRVLGSELPTF